MRRLPEIDFVVIGVNASATLKKCLESISAIDYPNHLCRLFYVDGGSTDDSIRCAGQVPGVVVVALKSTHPTPGRGRNAGWRAGTAPFVMFLDSDTLLHPGFLRSALPIFASNVGACQGRRRELFPEKSRFNWIGDQEWNGPVGRATAFGGDVLIKREVLQKTGGYNEVLVAGEDPEFSQRVLSAGFHIIQLDNEMTRHDLAMTTLHSYLKRAYRSGYGFAAVRASLATQNYFWRKESRRILIRGGMGLLFILSSIAWLKFSGWMAFLFMVFGIFLIGFPFWFRIPFFMKRMEFSVLEACIYSGHASVVVLPQFLGMLRFYYGQWFNRPMQNQSVRLATGDPNIGDRRASC